MKKKLKFLIAFIKTLKCGEFSVNGEIDRTEVQYINTPYCRSKGQIKLPQNVMDIIEELFTIYAEKLYDLGPLTAKNDSSSYFTADLSYYLETDKLVFDEITHSEYETQDTGISHHITGYNENDGMYETFMEVRKFLEKEGIEEMEVRYEGSGDNGSIEDNYTSEKGNGYIDEDIETICYNLLGEFGGWEINEGSQGTIYFTKDEITVNHEWNTEESYTNDINIEVNPEDFND